MLIINNNICNSQFSKERHSGEVRSRNECIGKAVQDNFEVTIFFKLLLCFYDRNKKICQIALQKNIWKYQITKTKRLIIFAPWTRTFHDKITKFSKWGHLKSKSFQSPQSQGTHFLCQQLLPNFYSGRSIWLWCVPTRQTCLLQISKLRHFAYIKLNQPQKNYTVSSWKSLFGGFVVAKTMAKNNYRREPYRTLLNASLLYYTLVVISNTAKVARGNLILNSWGLMMIIETVKWVNHPSGED